MSRRKLREHLFKLVYLYAFNSQEEMKEQLEFYFELNGEITGEERAFLMQRCEQVIASCSQIQCDPRSKWFFL